MAPIRFRFICLALTILASAPSAWTWGDVGHSAINRVAAEKLPAEVPEFLRSAAEELAYLGPEPDRWRGKRELALKASQEPDHYIDFERVESMTLPPDRYGFSRELDARREATPGKPDYLRPEKVGLLPYVVTEVYERLVV